MPISALPLPASYLDRVGGVDIGRVLRGVSVQDLYLLQMSTTQMDSHSTKVTAKQLPLYESCCGGKACSPKTAAPSLLEPYVKSTREGCEDFINPIVGDYPQRIREEVNSSVKLAKDSLDYLRDEKNQAARAAYITAIGFLGFILGRKGLIKRTTYGLIGAGAAAALCNPPLAKDYAEVSYELAKKKLVQLYDQYGGISYEEIKKLNWNPFEGNSKESK